MNGKKSFVLRMDNDTYKALEKWAADEFRSVNGQIEFILDKALKEAGRKKEMGKSMKSPKGMERK
ncbi:MAG: Arc family DNA binding domain-containing protein [Flavisolibacter sp.]|nr:Arc family DNA binding domain-containing protein [Flavisolibacter sp.]